MRDEAATRRFVLDYLRDGPADLDEMFRVAYGQFGYAREQIVSALEGIGVRGGLRRVSDGVLVVARPANLHAIWWSRRAPSHRFTGAAHGGGTAA
jgi:hypothetical protein